MLTDVEDPYTGEFVDYVSMHLLVPGAYRPATLNVVGAVFLSQCTFWCRVLTDGRDSLSLLPTPTGLNAPSGAGCLPTVVSEVVDDCLIIVSQCTFWCRVLTDFRRVGGMARLSICLNAPSGAGCLPTSLTFTNGV